jgi:hypothetical protein
MNQHMRASERCWQEVRGDHMYRVQECQLLCTRAHTQCELVLIWEEDVCVCDLAFRSVNLVPENYFTYSRCALKRKQPRGRTYLNLH